MSARLALLVIVLAACSDPELRDGVYACGAENLCPSGMSCGSDGRCHRGDLDGGSLDASRDAALDAPLDDDAGPPLDGEPPAADGGRPDTGRDASPAEDAGDDAGSGGDLVVQLAAGDYHTCARRERGAIICWGSNTQGQLGLSLELGSAPPTRVEGIPPAIDLAAGRHSTCIATDAGEAWCWGVNSSGQTVPASAEDPAVPQRVAGVAGAVLVATGDEHACAVVEPDRSVLCWGSNQRAQLGPDAPPDVEAVRPTAVPGLVDVVEIDAGQSFTCARQHDGSVLCWGDNVDGELGSGTDEVIFAGPRAVVGVRGAERIAAGSGHACVLAGDELRCWGNNASGQLAREPLAGSDISRTPVLVDIPGVLGLAAGGPDGTTGHTCARRALDVLCWGSNSYQQLGGRGGRAQPVPQVVDLVAAALGCGGWHSCAATPSGTVRCWGANDLGQLGFETGGDSVVTPTVVEGIP